MRQILVATDLSERSNRAAQRAGLLARREGDARVVLLHVVDDRRREHSIPVETAAAQKLLDAIIASELRDVSCEARIALGDPVDHIAKVATATTADLIVMGAHREQILRDALVGTSIGRVARRCIAPVLVVYSAPAGAYQRGLVAVDLSEQSGYALQTARALGVLPHSDAVIVHAFQVIARGKMGYAGVSPDEIAKHAGEVAKASRADLASFLDTLGDNFQDYAVRVKEGRPADVIIDVANMERADIVVMGTHGRTGILKLLLGSVTAEVMQRLERDVLIVPPWPQDARVIGFHKLN